MSFRRASPSWQRLQKVSLSYTSCRRLKRPGRVSRPGPRRESEATAATESLRSRWGETIFLKEIWPEARIIVTSGHVSLKDNDLPAGSRFIAKPYTAGHIVNTIRAVTA